MNALRTLSSNPVESLAAIALTVLGVAITYYSGQDSAPAWSGVCGGVATVLGGALLSWTVGKVVTKQQALNEVRSQLDLVSRNIGQAAAQISQAVDRSQQKKLHSTTAFELVRQGSTTIYAQVTAIQNILDSPFKAQDLLDTATELQSLANELSRRDGRNSDVHVVDRLDKLKQSLVTKSGSSRVHETVQCSECLCQTDARIGVNPGDTAMATCSDCGSVFNVHRRFDGSVFARSLKSSGQVRSQTVSARPAQSSINCPSCDSELRVSGKNGDPAICLNCGQNLLVNGDGVEMRDGSFDVKKGTVSGRYGSGGTGARPEVYCDSCGNTLRCIIRRDEVDYGIDTECATVFAVSRDELLAWRRKNEPESIHRAAPATTTPSTPH